jgi:hypothetical protein
MPTHCQAAKLSAYLTAKDLAQAELLDQNGQTLPPGSLHQRHSVVISGGSTPTYIAVPLYGGEHLPAGITTIAAWSQSGGTTVGPLDFDGTLKASLDAALAASATGVAVVDTPKQNYLVEYLPHHARSLSATTYGTAATTSSTTTAQTGSSVTTHSTKAASSSTASELSRLLTSGETAVSSLSTKSVAELEKLLDINTSKPTATKPSLNLEAQVLSTSYVLPAPLPEPSTWLVFSLILGAAGLRQRLRRGVG